MELHSVLNWPAGMVTTAMIYDGHALTNGVLYVQGYRYVADGGIRRRGPCRAPGAQSTRFYRTWPIRFTIKRPIAPTGHR